MLLSSKWLAVGEKRVVTANAQIALASAVAESSAHRFPVDSATGSLPSVIDVLIVQWGGRTRTTKMSHLTLLLSPP